MYSAVLADRLHFKVYKTAAVFFKPAGHTAPLEGQVAVVERPEAPAVQDSEKAGISHPVTDGFSQKGLAVDPGDKSAGMPLCPGDEITAVAVNGMAVCPGLGVGDPLPLSETDRCPFGRKGIGGADGRHEGLAVGLIIGSDDLLGHFLSGLHILPVSRTAAAAEGA